MIEASDVHARPAPAVRRAQPLGEKLVRVRRGQQIHVVATFAAVERTNVVEPVRTRLIEQHEKAGDSLGRGPLVEIVEERLAHR